MGRVQYWPSLSTVHCPGCYIWELDRAATKFINVYWSVGLFSNVASTVECKLVPCALLDGQLPVGYHHGRRTF